MMDGFRGYLLHLTAAALICSVVLSLLGGTKTLGAIVKLLCGIFFAYSLFKPLPELRIWNFEDFTADIRNEAVDAVAWGEKTARDSLMQSITQRVEAYILEKAKAMDVDLAVEVELSDDDVPIPVSVSLSGKAAPYAKTALSSMISEDLNISKENQIWISP